MKQITDLDVLRSIEGRGGSARHLQVLKGMSEDGSSSFLVSRRDGDLIGDSSVVLYAFSVNQDEFNAEKANLEKSALSEDEVEACRDLIAVLVRQVSGMRLSDEDMDIADWGNEEGVLMSGNECRLLLKALRFGTESPFNLK